MAHLHSVYDSDAHFSINPITRVLKNEAFSKTSLIQYDHNSERFTFEIPRMIEGHDMSLCNEIRVHYINIDSKTKAQVAGVYEVEDMQISPEGDDVVICSWLISRNATQLVGSLNFLIRFSCVTDGVVDYAWNTATYTGISVSSGIDADETFEEDYVDVIEQWKKAVMLEFEAEAAIITEDIKREVSVWEEAESANVRAEMTVFSKQWNDALGVERARIDSMVALPEGSTTGDAELADARIDYKGTNHGSVGAAIRSQVVEMNEKVEQRLTTDEFSDVFTKKRNEQLFDKDNATIVNGYISGTAVPHSFVTSTMGHKCILQEVEPGKTYCVSREPGMGTRFVVTAVASADDLTGLATATYGSVNDRYCATITVPENAHYILIFYRHPNDTTSEAENRATIKIEEGTTPTPGVSYYDYVATPNAEFPIEETVKYEPTRTIYLGANILTNEPTKGTGWSGSLANGFTHAAGNSQRISFFSANIEFGETYICEFDTSYTADEFVTVGIGTSYRILAYNGTGHIRLPLKAIGTADADKTLYFYPVSGVNFTISNITLRKIQAKTSTSEEMTLRLDNVRSTAHNSNYGFWNTILGLYALENGVGSTRTLALGYAALKALQGGHRNIAVGTFAMSQMTGGENNIGAGADAMLAVKQAEDNVVLGKAAAYNGSNIKNNVVLGAYAMTGTASSVATNNVVIGKNAGWYLTGNDNTFLGYQAGYKVGFANGNTCIGKNAYGESTGNHNTIVGEESGYSAGVNNSTAIGYQAKATKSNQMVLGGNNITETLCKGDLVVRGTDGVKRQIVFNADGTCTWVAVE